MSRPISMVLSQNGCDHASISTDQCHFTLLKKKKKVLQDRMKELKSLSETNMA